MFTFGSDSLAAPPGAGADGCLPGGEGADGRFGLAGVAGARGGARGCAGVLPGDRRWGRGVARGAPVMAVRRGEDLGPVAAEGHRCRAERAADLAGDGGAGDAVVAVGVVGGVPAELVPG